MARGRGWGEELPPEPHIWRTLGYRGISQGDGASVIEWKATAEFCFTAPSGPIVHGGMVSTLRAEGRVVQRNRRVAFCSAELYDSEGALLASSRCTQIIRRD